MRIARKKEPARPAASSPVLGCLAILAIVLLAYIPAMTAGFVWDDDDYVTKNELIQSPTGLAPIWFHIGATPQYYPLVFTAFWLEHSMWGLHPLGYHFVNVVLHGLASILLWRVLARLEVRGAWLAGAVFALHPVHVESVAWITERKNVLSAVFGLASILVLIPLFIADSGRKIDRGGRRYLFGVLLFACALLSKTVTCTIPVVLALVAWWKGGRVTRRHVLWLVLPLLMGLAMGLLTAWVEHSHVGAAGEEWSLTWLERGLVAGRVFWFYLYKLIWPSELTFIYPRWHIAAGQWWQYLFPAAAAALIFGLWFLRKRLGRGPAAAVLVFAVVIFPASGFINVYPMRYSFVADHFQYHASMAVIALLCASLAHAFHQLPQRMATQTHTRFASVLVLGLLAPLGVKTWLECGKFHDLETLWRDTLTANPAAWIAHNNLGALLKDEGKHAQAAHHLSEAVRLKPDHANAHANLASALIALNRLDEAAVHLERRLEMVPADGQAHLNLANILSSRAQADSAEVHYREAIRLLPQDALPLYNYAVQLADTNRTDEAIQHLRRALELKPGWPPAEQELARLRQADR